MIIYIQENYIYFIEALKWLNKFFNIYLTIRWVICCKLIYGWDGPYY